MPYCMEESENGDYENGNSENGNNEKVSRSVNNENEIDNTDEEEGNYDDNEAGLRADEEQKEEKKVKEGSRRPASENGTSTYVCRRIRDIC